jgi:putative ABC transport system permease protein
MSVLRKKIVRDILRTKGLAITVATVVASGAAIYVAMASAHRNLVLTRDAYYAEYRFADFFVMLEQAPVTARFRLEALPGIREVRCRIVKDVNLDIPGRKGPCTGRIVSMPDRPDPVLNGIAMISGRYFERGTTNEVILSDAFATANKLSPGDLFEASIDNRKHVMRVIGTALSPEYVYTLQGMQDIVPNAASFGVLWVSQTFAEQAFNMQGACNDIVGTVDATANMPKVLDAVERALDSYGVFWSFERKDQVSNNFLSSEIQGLGVNARIMPAIFFGVASLVLLVLLNRIVRQERTQIGLLKAYGYSNLSVAMMYVWYALTISLAGAIVGCLGGQALGNWMIRIYAEFYSFPVLRAEAYPSIMGRAIVLSAVFAVFGALSAARRAVRTLPAEAMRPEAPKPGHRTYMERVPAIWRRLSFTSKMIVRNVSRYKARAAITITGVSLAAALVFIGQFSNSSMHFMIDFQFAQTQLEDVRVGLESERDKDAWRELQRLEGVRRVEPLLEYPFEVRHGLAKKDLAITGMLPGTRMRRVVDTDGRVLSVDHHGVMFDEHLAEQLGVRAGDTVILKALRGRVDTEKEVTVSSIVPQYIGTGAYMDLHTLSRLVEEPFAMNAALLQTDNGAGREVAESLKDVAAVGSVTVKEDAYNALMQTLAGSMAASNFIIMFFASVIACAIIYNAASVSLMERSRELATLRVMGFTQVEVGRILYQENFFLSALGLLLGLPLGVAMCRLIVVAYETDFFRFPWHLDPWSFVKTSVVTLVFVLLANFALHLKIRHLDMISTLKERE